MKVKVKESTYIVPLICRMLCAFKSILDSVCGTDDPGVTLLPLW